LTERTASIRYPLRLTASLLGYGVTALVLLWSVTNRGFIAPDVLVWDRVGDQLMAGVSPYSSEYPWTSLFFYAPPWAFVFGLTSWLPIQVQAALVFAAELAALRYVAGSWLRVGYLGLIPITGGELANGSLNLVMAASVTLALRGSGYLAGLFALAKFSPILAVHPRDAKAALVIALGFLVTLQFWPWWADWLGLLLHSQAHLSIGYPIPWIPRVALAVGLLVVTRWAPWARAVAPFLAIPALYSYSLVLLYPLLRPRQPRDADLGVDPRRVARDVAATEQQV
jgi:hypothetical protein